MEHAGAVNLAQEILRCIFVFCTLDGSPVSTSNQAHFLMYSPTIIILAYRECRTMVTVSRHTRLHHDQTKISEDLSTDW